MAAAVRTRATRDRNATGKGCPCTGEGQLTASLSRVNALRGESELLQLGMLSGCCFHTLDRSRSRVS